MTLHFGRATPEVSMDPFPEKTTRAEREFAMDQELRWTAAASAAAPPTLVEYDEERELRGHSAGLPRDLAHDTYIPPEVRFTGRQNIPPNHPPMPWNPKMVTPIWFQTRGPFEAPPDDPMEWARTGRRADAGRRRYSAYANYNNRDGPRMMPGLHPSRSALRPMAPTPVRTIPAHVLECRSGTQAPQEYGSAADSLECATQGYLTVHYANGRTRPVRGAFLPERRPFTGLTEIIPASAGQSLEGNPRWSEITDERSAALGHKQKGHQAMRPGTSSNTETTVTTKAADSRPLTRGSVKSDFSATFADETFMNDIVTEFDAESRANSRVGRSRH